MVWVLCNAMHRCIERGPFSRSPRSGCDWKKFDWPPDITPPFAEEFDIRADIPGVSKGDIHLMVDNDVLSISVASKAAKQVKGWPFVASQLFRHLNEDVLRSHLGRSARYLWI